MPLDTTVQDNYVFDDAAINGLDPEKRTVLVTTHRRENLGEPMRHVYQAIRDLINEFEDIQVVFPVHKNPKVRQVVQEELGSVERVTLIDPLDYEPFANLMAKSYLILTDSGGIQEEAPALVNRFSYCAIQQNALKLLKLVRFALSVLIKMQYMQRLMNC